MSSVRTVIRTTGMRAVAGSAQPAAQLDACQPRHHPVDEHEVGACSRAAARPASPSPAQMTS
jgi:hypothetical protein